MGVRDPRKNYMACWFNLSDRSMLAISEVAEPGRLRDSLKGDALSKRLKFILNPVKIGVPVPVKGPKDAETVGSFFGSKGASLTWSSTDDGVEFAVLQIDLHSKMLLRMMLKQMAFRDGNVVEMMITDWPGRVVLTSVHLSCTAQALQLLR